MPERIEAIRRYCEANDVPLTLIQVDSLQKAKELPGVFNNWGVFYKGKFETVNVLDTTYLKRILKNRSVADATTHGVLRIIQSVPSPKAEPFKLWLAQVGAERIEETVDPEQGIDRAFELVLNMLADALSDVEAWRRGCPAAPP